MPTNKTNPAPAVTRKGKSLAGSTRSASRGASTASVQEHSSMIARIPDASVATKYISRNISMGGRKHKQDLEILDYAFENGMNVLIEGPTGPGKTMFSRAWGASRKKMLARVPSNVGIDKSALFGKYVPDRDKGGFTWVDGGVTYIVRHGGIILINEVNFVPERVGTVLFGLLDDSREIVLDDKDGEIVRAHRPDCWCDLPAKVCKSKWVLIVADMNPEYLGTRGLNAAFRNRWELQLVWDYDDAVEAKLIKSGSLRSLAGQLRVDARKQALTTPISTNMLMEFERIAMDLSVDFAVSNFVSHFAAEERDAVTLVCDTHKDNVEADLLADDAADYDEVPEFAVDDDIDDWLYTEDEKKEA